MGVYLNWKDGLKDLFIVFSHVIIISINRNCGANLITRHEYIKTEDKE